MNLVDQQFKANYMHILFAGTDITEKRYTFMEGDDKIGEMHVYIEGSSMYIDHFEIKEMFRGAGWGTKIVEEMFNHFIHLERIWAMAKESVLDSFWSKQKGFNFIGEGHDEQEGYFWFEVNKTA